MAWKLDTCFYPSCVIPIGGHWSPSDGTPSTPAERGSGLPAMMENKECWSLTKCIALGNLDSDCWWTGGREAEWREGGVQVVRPDEVSIYLVLQWRRRDLLGFGCHPVTRCTFFPCIMGPDDSGWELPVNNLEVMSFIELHIVLNLRLKPHGRKYKKQYTSRVPGEAWTEAEETHPARLTGDNVKIRTRRKVLDSRNTYESPVSADPGRHSFT